MSNDEDKKEEKSEEKSEKKAPSNEKDKSDNNKDLPNESDDGEKRNSVESEKGTSATESKNFDFLQEDPYYVIQRGNKRTCHVPQSVGVNVKARRKLIIASILCLFFIIAEVVGGVLSNSLAVAADAAHTLTDFAGFMIALFAIWLAGRNATDRLSFGWYRAEVIGALASIFTIWCVTAVLVWLAIQRCIHSDFEIASIIMMVTAVFGFITNIFLAIVLMYNSPQTETTCEENDTVALSDKKTSYGHSHGGLTGKLEKKLKSCWRKMREKCGKKYDKQNTIMVAKCRQDAQQNINIRAAMLHVIGDGLQSLGVLVAAIIIYFRPDWVLADPICTFLFAMFVIYSTINILKDVLIVLMEGTPTFVDYKEVQSLFKSIEGVQSVHGLRIWALSIDKIALAVHLVVENNVDPKIILEKAERVIHSQYHLYETTIQIEEDAGTSV